VIFHILLSSQYKSISELKKLLDSNCKIEKIQPPVFASDAETNMVMVIIACPDGKKHTIKAFREESHALREFIRSYT
jgi:hypothetical protein